MSIATELNKTISSLQNARRAILARGGTINTTAGLKDLPEAIFNMPTGDALGNYTDSEIAYEKVVYPMAENYARVAQIGGMTYKCNNLMPFPYADTEKTRLGITFTPLDDGGIKLFGTAEAASSFILATLDDINLVHGQTYSIGSSFNDYTTILVVLTYYDVTGTKKYWGAGGSSLVWDSAYTLSNIYIQVQPNKTVDTVVYPMLNEGSTALPYEPYFAGLRDTKVTKIESAGANLLNIEAPLSTPSNTDSSNTTPRLFEHGTIVPGMAYNNYYRPDKCLIIERTSNSITFVNAAGYGMGFAFDLEPNTKYSISCEFNVESPNIGVALYKDNGELDTYIAYLHNSKTFTTNSSGKCVIVFIDQDTGMGDAKEMTISNVMLVKGANIAPYKPYRTDLVDTWDIPKAIQLLDGYGEGLPASANIIDFENKKYIQNCKKAIFTGDETWKFTSNESGVYYCVIKGYEPRALGPQNQINSHFGYGPEYKGGSVHPSGICRFYVYDKFPTLEEWIAYIKEQYNNGTPIESVIVIAEPIETDISAYLPNDNFIAVEGGGVLTFVNEHKQPVPSTIQYLYKTEGE